MIPLHSTLILHLRDYMRARGGDADAYPFYDEYGKGLTENALRLAMAHYNRSRGVGKTFIHMFRHIFARKYLIGCGGRLYAAKLLGHSTL